MTISAEDVAKIALLARLELDEETSALYAGQLGDVLEYMNTLNALDTKDVEPLYSPAEQTTVLRQDVARKTNKREDVLANAPENDGTFFIVPKIV
ncbi:MAG: Asp-tRNA(Asn)/Glu-tRNA(Gln) amidotransferase subunit GatC [Desulfovibrio sp.]|uniref:Asp-tRNA(Asn)/Glu-tRNA(Gln) amidotransferase subunit GatC n=1 Tax=Desulfovibrio sp. 7SRBS1 TaxID=3378064 RepID=UPI003B3E7F99